MKTSKRNSNRKGLTSTMAMMLLALAGAIALGMYAASTTSVATASNLIEGDRARLAAESGMRWVCWRFQRMTRPKTGIGNITPEVAQSLWPEIAAAIENDLASMLTPPESSVVIDEQALTSSPIAVNGSAVNDPYGARFVFIVRPHPLTAGDRLDGRHLRVTATGSYHGIKHTIDTDLVIDKKVKFAIVSAAPVRLGRNTLVQGSIGISAAGAYPEIETLSDFRHLNSTLANQVDRFRWFVERHHEGYDNRIDVNSIFERAAAERGNYRDVNSDGFIDEYDLFLKYFDLNHDNAISREEFTDPASGQLFDADLFAAIDELGGSTDGVLNNSDGYVKIHGQVVLATTASAWHSRPAAIVKMRERIQGPIQRRQGDESVIRFGASRADLFDLAPMNFTTGTFRNRTGSDGGPPRLGFGKTFTIENKVLTVADNHVVQISQGGATGMRTGDLVPKARVDAVNEGLPLSQRASGIDVSPGDVVEHTPFSSTSIHATYTRPVFRNMHFRNLRIAKGLNALFDNCTFEGVTFVELQANVTDSHETTITTPTAGVAWAQRMKSGTFSSTTPLKSTNSFGFSEGNNLRFHNCVIRGPMACDVPSAFTGFGNAWEFTGTTTFDNTWIDESSGVTTASIIAPQTKVLIAAPAAGTLRGAVVAGALEIRGRVFVDGSIIVTGEGGKAATFGWFDGDGERSHELPAGNFGRVNIRYNPTLPLPDGIVTQIDLTPIATK